MWAKRNNRGFTIVELLIVIVVVAILAAITVVSYNGIQQRANNTAIISAASQTIKLVKAYYGLNSSYPSVSTTNICTTTSSGCIRDTGAVEAGNTSFATNLATIGTIPLNIPTIGPVGNGIIYNYAPTRTFNGQSKPAMVFYWLNGTNQQCGVSDVMDSWETSSTSTTGYTSGNSASIGKTLCFVSISV